MFNTIKKARLSIDDFASIVGVSRVAVFNWKAGRSRPHPQISDRVKRAAAFLEAKVKAGELPLSPDLSRDEKKAKVKKLKESFAKSL